MAKGKKEEFPEALRVRLTTEQAVYLRDVAELHGIAVSDLVRGIIEHSRANYVVDHAIATLNHIDQEEAHVNGK